MSAQQRERAERRHDGRRHGERGSPGGDDPAATEETEFLEAIVWALDGLARHADRRGLAGLTQSLSAACRAARAELDAARPRPAEIASARMRALWQQEGRG